jgi:voltage-gated potassium channel Kch|tara:strand:+ start:105 stop:1655 length:1551 start_codon:yes stop_codon:yes gene_type:complete
MTTNNTGSVAKRYAQLETDRSPFLERAREAAELSIPTLMPPKGHTGSTDYPTPYQSIGARGVNNLASKLLMTLLPPNAPFFRLTMDDFDVQNIAGEGTRGKVEEALGRIERAAMQEVETKAIRVPVFEAIKQLIVAGNVLVHMPKEGGVRVFRLDRYVCQRDAMGNVLEIIIKETVSPQMLPQKVKELLTKPDEEQQFKNVDLYTHVKRVGKKWEVYQEVEGVVVPNSQGSYPISKSPFMSLRMVRIDGESYGRGYVEEFIGDLSSLETLTKAIVQGSAAAAKVLFLVRPNGTTKQRVLATTPNGGIAAGDANDVSVLQLQKQGDFRVAQETARELTERLAFAFLMNSAVQRKAERVTAEEVRFMAQELEAALGGVYSILSQEFQYPLVQLLLDRMEKAGKLPKFPEETLKPQIVTGMEALGRGQDLNKLAQLLQFLQPLGPELIQRELNVNDYIDRLGASLGIDTDGLIKSEEQKAQEQQMAQQQMMQQQMMQLAEKATPPVAQGLMKQQEQQGN